MRTDPNYLPRIRASIVVAILAFLAVLFVVPADDRYAFVLGAAVLFLAITLVGTAINRR